MATYPDRVELLSIKIYKSIVKINTSIKRKNKTLFFCLKNQFWVIKICQIKRKTKKIFFFLKKNLTKKLLVGMYELSFRN